jgi:hypothetical protein
MSDEAKGELVPSEPGGAVTPMHLLELATRQGADVDKLGKLMDLQLRWQADEARKAFVVALISFKASPPTITKNKAVDFTSAKGRTHYKHATLDNVSGIIGAALAEVGISHRWETEQLDGGLIRVTCILTHAMGHSEKVWLQASRDESGNKNNIQAVGSTVTYLQRYTLLAATGMAVQDQDDDGAGGQGTAKMTEAQKADWLASIEALEAQDAAVALWTKIAAACEAIGDVPAYSELHAAMARKRKALGAKL